jgi:PAS domain S-box-containing protein
MFAYSVSRGNQESAYRAIFEASSDGLVINDAETGIVLEANPAFCRMHGYDRMVGLHPTTFVHPSSHHLFEAYVGAIREGREFRTRAQDVRRDGTIFDVEVVGRGFMYQGNFALLGVVRDMTEHVRAYQHLEERVAERTREIEHRREVAEALSELLAVVNSRRALDDMLKEIVAQAARLLGSDAEALYLIDEADPALLRLEASRNIPPAAEPLTVAMGTPLMGLAAERLRPVVAVDLAALIQAPFVTTTEEQIADRGSFLELVRCGPVASTQAARQRGNQVMAEQFHSLLAVPLIARESAHGALMLAYRTRHIPADDELELIAAFAGQAALAIESARLQQQAEQRRLEAERRRQIAEGLRDLLATVNSTRTLNEVLEAVTSQARQLLGSDASAIYTPDGQPNDGRLRAFASSGLNPTFASYTLLTGVSATGMAFEKRRPVAIYDTSSALGKDARARNRPVLEDRGSHLQVVRLTGARPAAMPIAESADQQGEYAAGYRALLAVPLAVKDQIYGALTLYFHEACEFTSDQVEIASTFADQAALAIENARLHDQSERRRREMEVLYYADERLYQSLRLDDVLQALVAEAASLLGAERTSVLVWDDFHQRLSVRAAHGFEPEVIGRMSFAPHESISGQVAITGELISVRDVLQDPRIPAYVNRAINQDGAIRSLVCVPIKLEGEVFGVFNVNSSEPRSFGGEEQQLLLALAQRAAIAIQNARLHEESEQRRQELEAFYQADQALHRSLRLEDVLDVLVDLPIALGRAEMVSLFLWDEQQRLFVVGQVRGLSDAMLADTFTLTDLRLARASDRGIVEVDDAASDSRIGERLKVTIQREGVRAWISAPIRIGGHLFGSFSFGYSHPHVFADRERRLLSALAQRAALAIQNARLHEESERQRQELEGLYDADAALHRSLRLQDVLNALVDAAIHLLRVDGAGLWGPDDQHPGRIVPLASRGLSATYLLETMRLNDEPGVLEFWHRHHSVAVEDIKTSTLIPESQREPVEREGYRALLTTQISVGAEPFGSFTVGLRRPHQFSEQERRLLSALAQRAGLAIQNARLYEQAQQAAALEERQRLARELHDAVTQTLFSTALIAEVIPQLWDIDENEARARLSDLRRLTRGALAEMRTLLVELRPDALTELALGDLLRQLAEATAGRTRLEVDVHVEGPVRRLPPAIHIALYRLAQEALNNIVKHAQASQASVGLLFSSTGVMLRVVDDGRGFIPETATQLAGHFGLGIMRERAASIAARFRLVSHPGEGTLVEVAWGQGALGTDDSPSSQVRDSSTAG